MRKHLSHTVFPSTWNEEHHVSSAPMMRMMREVGMKYLKELLCWRSTKSMFTHDATEQEEIALLGCVRVIPPQGSPNLQNLSGELGL
jgi:hypothetical protein